MAFPQGVRTRQVTCGKVYPPVSIIDSQYLSIRLSVTSNRSLIWNGEQITKIYNAPKSSAPDQPIVFEAIVTDMVGMVDAETMQVIDISDGRQTHLLEVDIKVFYKLQKLSSISRTIAVPTGVDPLDLDSMIMPDPELGILIPNTGVTPEQIQEAVDSYMDDHPSATPQFVTDAISQHISSPLPHPVYDDMADLSLILENGLV